MSTELNRDSLAEASPPNPKVKPPERDIRKIVFAAYLGTALEWYDFFLFGTTAAIVFGPLFFPGDDPAMSTIQAFLSFAVGFIAKPIGALLFGHIGDRYGRRHALVISLLAMGIASALVGLLPTYASIGVVAPILLTLLRAVQGVAVGGEWSGATLLAIENAEPKRRGFYASMTQMGMPTATILSSVAVMLVTLLPHDQFMSWGWRLPFIASIALMVVGLWMRWRLEETPVFKALESQSKVQKVPVAEVLRRPGTIMLAVGVYLFATAGFYVMTTFMISYATQVKGLPASTILNAITIGAFAQFAGLIFAGRLSSKIGSGRTVAVGYVCSALVAFPLMFAIDSANGLLITVAYLFTLGLSTICIGPIGHLIAQLFPPQYVYTGLALSAGIASIAAGFMPAIAAWLSSSTDDALWAPALLMIGLALISLLSTGIAQRRITRASIL
ncbi:major facilitator superfamily protein (plasmid) [Rhodococcus erythropolis]|uniref:MFS transporter n=1 Tax=Rhodococcus erythropolis TaxID=1833 RepID=UPI000655C7C3|nr:MFS transporter [Rhodococcus erythropolis]AKE01243.2 major facilitator superfamily protein [Rhodococcus erythropolis]